MLSYIELAIAENVVLCAMVQNTLFNRIIIPLEIMKQSDVTVLFVCDVRNDKDRSATPLCNTNNVSSLHMWQ